MESVPARKNGVKKSAGLGGLNVPVRKPHRRIGPPDQTQLDSERSATAGKHVKRKRQREVVDGDTDGESARSCQSAAPFLDLEFDYDGNLVNSPAAASANQQNRRGRRWWDGTTPYDELPFVSILPVVAKLTNGMRGGNAAIFLARLVYWSGMTKAGRHRLRAVQGVGPRIWTPGYPRIFQETGLNKQKAQRAIKQLEKAGLIEVTSAGCDDYCHAGTHQSQRNGYRLTDKCRAELESASQVLPGEQKPKAIRVRVSEVLITSTGNEAIVLGDIVRWFEPNERGQPKKTRIRNGKRWRANRYEKELSVETGLTFYQAKQAIQGLKKAGIIHRDYFLWYRDKALHVRPDREALNRAYQAAVEKLKASDKYC